MGQEGPPPGMSPQTVQKEGREGEFHFATLM